MLNLRHTFLNVLFLGAPQVLRRTSAKEVDAISGRDVELRMEVCSDPMPSKSTWDWGQAQVEVGQVKHSQIVIFWLVFLLKKISLIVLTVLE